MIPVTPTEISHSTDAAWTDVDVTSYVDAGNTAGVLLHVVNVNTAYTAYEFGVRKNGSTDNRYGDLYGRNSPEVYQQTWIAVGVDSNDIFELYLEDASEIDVYIVAYFKDDIASFDTNLTEQENNSNEDAWYDMDISSATGADTAKVAFFHVDSNYAGTWWYVALRENGSTDDRISDAMVSEGHIGMCMSVDGNEVLEYYRQDPYVEFYLAGWMTDQVGSQTNATNYTASGSGSFEDVDFSSDMSGGYDGAFFQMNDTDTGFIGFENWAIRKNGSSDNVYATIMGHAYGWVEVDDNQVAEQKVEDHTNDDLYLWGWSSSTGTLNISVSDSVTTAESVDPGDVANPSITMNDTPVQVLPPGVN